MNISRSFLNKVIFSLAITLVLCFICVFNIKSYVKEMRKNLDNLDKEIAAKIQSLDLLEAELAYLTTPERIEELTKKHIFDMQNINASQVKKLSDINSKSTIY